MRRLIPVSTDWKSVVCRIFFAEKIIMAISKVIPLPGKMAFYISTLVIGPILGSFITEPAAMTVTALILLDYF